MKQDDHSDPSPQVIVHEVYAGLCLFFFEPCEEADGWYWSSDTKLRVGPYAKMDDALDAAAEENAGVRISIVDARGVVDFSKPREDA